MILPEVGRSIPPITASSVDLPEPDGPITLTELPAGTSRSTPRKILTGPAVLVRVMWTSSRWIMLAGESDMDTMGQKMGHMACVLKAPTAVMIVAIVITALSAPTRAQNTGTPCRIAVLGDSLTASYGIPIDQGFPAQLQRELNAAGHDCVVLDAGVSGDTTAGGLARLDWMLAEQPSHVIIELGANDALRARPPEQMATNLDAIVTRLTAAGIPALLTGMVAPPNLGEAYGDAFTRVFRDVAVKHGIPLYPFFLDGVAGDPSLNQADGLHPLPEGIAMIVERMLPTVIDWLDDQG